MQELKGLGVAMVTPFTAEGKPDFSALEKLIHHLHRGVDYLVVMGTTGEAATLSEKEQLTILDFVLEINAGKMPVVFGLGGNNTAEITTRMRNFDRKGVAAFLSASPGYNKPTQEGIYRHYLALSAASNLPIIVYNVPGRTASNILPETILRIAENAEKVIGIKEAAGSIEQVMELARTLPEKFLLLSGDDAFALPHMACGGHGIISVIANAYPVRFGKVVRAALSGNYDEARKQHYNLLPIIPDLFREGNPGGVKEVMKHLLLCENHMRLPLFPVSSALSQKLYRHIADIGEV